MITLLLAVAHGMAPGDEVHWRLPVAPGHVAQVRLVAPGRGELARWRIADGVHSERFGWRPDQDPRPGQVSGGVHLWLPEGDYQLVTDEERRDLHFEAADQRASGHPVAVLLPPGGEAVLARREGHLAWAPATDRRGTLWIDDERWSVVAQGGENPQPEDLRPGQASVVFPVRARPTPPPARPSGDGWVRLGLVPVTLLLGVFGGLGAWRRRRSPGLLPAALALGALALLVISSVLGDLPGRLLDAAGPIRDPLDSAAQLAVMADALPRLSAIGHAFGWPEGTPWTTTGPAWLGYLLPAALVPAVGAIGAHDLGVGLGLWALGLTLWGVLRSAGLGPWSALAGGLLGVIAPAILDEVDAMSLDRSTLFMVPLALWLLHRAAAERRAVLPAGIALGGVVYGQVYYGIYLLAAAPLLALLRLPGPAPLRRLGRLVVVGLIAGAVALPGLLMLRSGLDVQSHAPVHSAAPLADPWHPVSAERAAQVLGERPGGAPAHFELDTAEGRLLAAVGQSLTLPDLLQPVNLFPGRSLFWPLALLSLALARRRHAAALALADVLVLGLLALGPLLRWESARLGPVLPYYAAHLLIPGFDQLKNVHRYALMAAAIAPLPLAHGLHGLLSRLPARAPPLLAAPVVAALAGLRLPVLSHGPTIAPSWELRLPRARALPLSPALAALPQGPVLALPLDQPTPDPVVRAALRAGTWLLNEPPFEVPRRLGPPRWDTDPVLNRLGWLSGSTRPIGPIGWKPALAAPGLRALAAEGLRGIALFRQALAGPELSPDTEALLDAHLDRVGDDGAVVAWSLEHVRP